MSTVLQARPRNFVSTPAVERIARRALRYLQSGYSVHLRGPAGTGKTTLALHLADLLSRPIMLVFGDDEFKTSDLIGNQSGYTRKKVVDNFIHSVVKVEDELRHNWVDSRLTLACREGFTLVYDEFNRSRPEVNNVLLSALEEKLLVLPPSGHRPEYLRVNPHFRAIFTSNPEEYAGVHGTQDALLDRLITIHMPEPDELTQQQILVQKVGIDSADALLVVRLVKAFHTEIGSQIATSLRPSLMIANICHEHGVPMMTEDADFRDVCSDVLLSRITNELSTATQALWDVFNELTLGVAVTSTAAGAIAATAQPDSKLPKTGSTGSEKPKSATKKAKATNSTKSPASDETAEAAVLGEIESSILTFLTAKDSASLTEIESELSLTRFKAVDALRSLIEMGYLQKQNTSGKPAIYRLQDN
ncbi:MAG: gas vesicle protein GvpN [Leptolyngbya sp. SIOISBB]|nr:gas vesicle protein GvpN [Leptolyngbya sp. SIOISBB]